ncbi:SSU ribosomal protein S12P methylthiotransferase [Desulfitobacterium sp. LBE]|uniref:Ribosomal protein uS12 methylthiotransferase RimO n=1 Tax=Desulfitobacterium hafniense TaxID=49338 RepID=A0A0W1JNA7_DESHA|nr:MULTISPECIES: 30S ribosomal protein S12 methylthiotransferase RimO [Desulfitobacterium]KTE93191.1 ribosomal protein S12 methylthiotransferase RimO [Desulfitobacterium hafniense]TWH56029.1 SSU ribosomal protein S12P methylthiotransferase [Desulfitobacterium sp. LBE]
MNKKVAVVTLGCPKNQVDSEIMTGHMMTKYQIVNEPEQADIIIINTCTFIESAKAESIDMILQMSQYKEEGQCQTLVATGCLAQRYGDELLAEIPELDGIMGTGNVAEILETLEEAEKSKVRRISAEAPAFIYDETMPRVRLSPKQYAYVKVAEGCDNYCTYCIIPHVRGHFRSRTQESILREVEAMASEGVKEVLLIAQDTTRYGKDRYGEYRLPSLIKEIAGIEGIEWIRLMYCYPELFTDELITVMKETPKVCRYLDLPLQHAHDKVLSEMNRRGTIREAEGLIHKLRQEIPDIRLRTTMITGFPGETEEEFQAVVDFAKKIRFDRLGAFAYSQEESTPAAQREDQVPEEIRQQRRDQLMELQHDIAYEQQQRWVGQTLKVLIEEALPDQRWVGRSEGDAPEIDGVVYVDSPGELEIGDFVLVKITGADSYDLMGEVVQ